ncbi:putative membrane protein [Nonlabens dokdonensis]|uniref:DUF2254 domain-containing protein n=2 Tax=Nonlabens dokdonensis TaxID=328515 RepID=L7WDN7_NONDD|nr:DUF2254 domain-containing protein [Nonlabens dokdonensis]AGC78352.1 hypothetical protein DDD_3225 [Nonlabens dokdonensis DSW-6]PZX38104.1 putative membrane protein [Nonlabens dokdonensis]
MKALIIRIRSFINTITGSIAFYPTFYAISAVVFALIMKWAEEMNISSYLQEHLPQLVINDIETARTILTTLIAGGISMLVFSFSMVMLLLSQAAANYSPRVLPNLISNRRHQFILGTFLATILYNIITVIGLEPTDQKYQLPGFSVLLGIISAFLALGAFVYFIHSISTSIQINNILEDIFKKSSDRLKILIDEEKYAEDFPDTSDWHVYKTKKSGTIQNISVNGLKEAVEEFETKFEVLIVKGQYILTDSDMFLSEKELKDEELEEIYKNFNYSESELVSDNYALGFKQITEIGIKAMSPGINDPGTAIDTIDYLTELVRIRMQKQDHSISSNKEDKPVLKVKVIAFETLIYNVFASYRNYCKHDLTVMQKLLQLFSRCIERESCQRSYHEVLHNQAKLLIHDAEESISNQHDLNVLKNQFQEIEDKIKSIN